MLNKKEGGVLMLLITGIVIPLVVGRTSPWWYDNFFKAATPTSVTSEKVSTPTPVPSISLRPDLSSNNYSASLKVKIDLNQEQKVERKQTVIGTFEGLIPSDRKLYFYVYIPTLQDFPFYYFPVQISGKSWRSSAIFGSVEDSNQGASFVTGLVLASPQDPKWNNRNSDNGLPELVGENLVTQTTVQRK